MRIRFTPLFILAVPVVCLFTFLAYELPPIHDRLAWRLENLTARVRYALNPPEQIVFVPQEQVSLIVAATLTARIPTASPQTSASTTSDLPQEDPGILAPTFTPSPTPLPLKPLPEHVRLEGFVHIYQNMNNCGPATLAMALSYWDWPADLQSYISEGTTRNLQLITAAALKPNPEDKNVNPYEMKAYIESQPGLLAETRLAGDTATLKRLTAAGFPVIIEKGFQGDTFEGWMGHYGLIVGYDEATQNFLVLDSYVGPDSAFPIPYTDVIPNWRAFNWVYIVIYPTERQAEVLALLGPDADLVANVRHAADLASAESQSLSGRDRYFAMYNLGSSLVQMSDYLSAALAYDQAAALYAALPKKERPWRMLWYQDGPYAAYFYTGRYADVIDLADLTITTATESKPGSPFIEESFYWRGMARLALGDQTSAVEDFTRAIDLNPNYAPPRLELEKLGIE